MPGAGLLPDGVNHLLELVLEAKDFFPDLSDVRHQLDQPLLLTLLGHLHFQPLPKRLLEKVKNFF